MASLGLSVACILPPGPGSCLALPSPPLLLSVLGHWWRRPVFPCSTAALHPWRSSLVSQTGQGGGCPALGWQCPASVSRYPVCRHTEVAIPWGHAFLMGWGCGPKEKGGSLLCSPGVLCFYFALGSVAGPARREPGAAKQQRKEAGQLRNSIYYFHQWSALVSGD